MDGPLLSPASSVPTTPSNVPDPHAQPVSAKLQIINIIAVFLPVAGFVACAVASWGWGLDWRQLIIFVVMTLITGVGITVGYHRLFTHKAFKTSRAVQAVLGVIGSMAVEGPICEWVAQHRLHHQHSDHDGDPHSPHLHGAGVAATLRGLWHAHMGWMLREPAEDEKALERYIPDLMRNSTVTWLTRLFPLWALGGLVLPALAGGLLTLSWKGALLGFLWGGLARVFFVHHATWSINSICHIWGTRPFNAHDESRNNLIFGVLSLGEGWHNNHHAFPTSARHGLAWWQIDASWWIIRLMEITGMAWNVRLPGASQVAMKRGAAI